MTKLFDEAVKVALTNIDHVRELVTALHMIRSELSDRYNRSTDPRVSDAVDVLNGALHEKETGYWRDYAILALSEPELQKEVRQRAYNRYMEEGVEIMSWLREGRVMPPSYATTDEDKWRAEIEERFNERRNDKANRDLTRAREETRKVREENHKLREDLLRLNELRRKG